MIDDQMVLMGAAAIAKEGFPKGHESAAEYRTRLSRAALTAIGDAVVVPAGWRLVPIEPTREMTMHACNVLPSVDGVFGHAGRLSAEVYKWMLEVAPNPSSNHDGTTTGGAA